MSETSPRGRFVWYDLLTTDPGAAEDFYKKVAGWGTQEWSGSGANPYTMWTTENVPIGGVMAMAPEMQGAKDFDVSAIRLPPLRVAEWQGLVFVALSDQVPPFEAVYGDIAARIAPIDLSAMSFLRRDSYVIDCDWKVYVDNFLEGYHLPHVHPGLSKVLDYRAYDTELLPKLTAPLLWVAGTEDNGQRNAEERFKLAPSTPLNRFVLVKADHFATPDVAVNDMMAWLEELRASLKTN